MKCNCTCTHLSLPHLGLTTRDANFRSKRKSEGPGQEQEKVSVMSRNSLCAAAVSASHRWEKTHFRYTSALRFAGEDQVLHTAIYRLHKVQRLFGYTDHLFSVEQKVQDVLSVIWAKLADFCPPKDFIITQTSRSCQQRYSFLWIIFTS